MARAARRRRRHERNRFARFAAVAAVAAVAVAVAATVLGAHEVEPAGAFCDGTGRPRTLLDYFAQEDPRSGTCDGDNIYRGTIRDIRTDGSCVFVNFADAGRDFGAHARSCSSSGTNFTWHDQGGPRAAYERTCIDGYRDCSVWVGNVGY